ncbi:MAG: 16S rRNA (cytosine(967)-C(5))-methyltransferase RsmB, partial [Pseudomonadota bacterium]|nr:16S rRNA (cytosine(967)-C(5))-methyltransferase RsmB [Pseudomonadota bacterium]
MHSAYSLAALIISRTLSGQTLTQVIAEQKIHPSINSAAIRDLSSNALRYLGKSTFIIQKLSKQHKRDQEVDALLHIGISQISLGKPPYAIVNSVVEACNTLNKGWAKSYINAMLRNYLRQKESLDNLCYHNEVSRYNHPTWWINELKQDWPDDWISILTANQTHPPMTLRVNRKKISPDHYAHMLDKEDIGYSRFINDAIILEKPRSVQTVPGFQDGLVSVQDASAQWAAYLLDVLPEHRVLDACCAPGGKAAHILELSDADLTALDLDTKRIKMTESTFNRL